MIHRMESNRQVTDFVLACFKPTSRSERQEGMVGTYRWMAPEVMNNHSYTEKADVFSYGIVLWEIFTRAVPYGKLQRDEVCSIKLACVCLRLCVFVGWMVKSASLAVPRDRERGKPVDLFERDGAAAATVVAVLQAMV